jgi:hypothetical protein
MTSKEGARLEGVALLGKGPYAVQGVLAGVLVAQDALPMAEAGELCHIVPHAGQQADAARVQMHLQIVCP